MMKMNRKALALLVSAMLAAATAGCGNPAENDGSALEAVASLPESVTEMGAEPDAGEPAATTEPTTEPTAEPTVEPTVEPTTEPAVTAEPTTETAATTEPKVASEPAETQSAANSAAPGIAANPPATSGVVTNTETVTTQVEHQRPAGMPAVCYSQEETVMAMLLYGGVGDGYVDNGDGTWSYCYCTPDGVTTDTVTSTVTTDNWYSGTESDVLAKLDELRAAYPEGTPWDGNTMYNNPGSTIDAYISNNNACAGFAKLVSDYCFGYDTPCRECVKTTEELKVGDLCYDNYHAWIYTGGYEPNGGGYLINAVSGNHNNTVIWSAGATSGSGQYRVITRWPE